MSTLALLLAGPLQAWGSSARFARRTTENAPTKSGVLGLLAAAQGRTRETDLSDLADLRFGVRVDQPGRRLRDYQTAHHGETGESMPVSARFYLVDAVFVAAVEGDDALISALYDAVRRPYFLPYLGRRSCPPSAPIDIGVYPRGRVGEVLESVSWLASSHVRRKQHRQASVELDVLLDATSEDESADTQRDVPVSFDPRHRQHRLRGVTHQRVRVANPSAEAAPHHDPMSALGDE